jgi:Flp pilus assembly protein TadG
MALTVDTGMLFNARGELQSAADAAALAAALQLGSGANAASNAAVEAANIAAQNKVKGTPAYVDANDLVFGHAVLNGAKYVFQPNVTPYDAVQVTVRRDGSSGDKPRVPLMFGSAFSSSGAEITASATAMLVPRDIAVVFDLSASMNDDSELRHYKNFASEVQGTRPAVQINLKDIWSALPQAKGRAGIRNGSSPSTPPSAPTAGENQPSVGSGVPHSAKGNPDPNEEPASGSGNPAGPRWGWMTDWGTALTLGVYSPSADWGLYYIPRNSTTSASDVDSNLSECGYSSAERSALLSGSNDGNFTHYTNRVTVLLGLAGWKSGKSGGKWTGTGNGDNKVDSNELTQTRSWPWSGGSWNDYISYVSANNTQMYYTDSSLRYRYGIKTVVNYLLERQANNSSCSDLPDAPEMPIKSAKDAVQTMIDLIVSLDTQDHVSLEVFATSSRHEVNLTIPSGGQSLASALQVVPATLYERQAGHYDSTTNIGAGLNQGLTELTSSRARSAAAKVIILLTDGKPNVGSGSMSPEAYTIDRATAAANNRITIYCVGLGGDADPDLLQQIADIGGGQYFYADSAPDPITGQPQYVSQLNAIFNELGGKRPVRLID